MTEMTDEQWRQVDAAVERIGATLRAFHDGLADEEHLALHLILGRGAAAGTDEDAAGYAYRPLLAGIESVRFGLDAEHCSTGKGLWPPAPFGAPRGAV